MKFNYWESFGIQLGITALQAVLAKSSVMTPAQKDDLEKGLAAMQQIQSDFAG